MATAATDKRTRKRASDRITEILDIVDARLNADRSAAVSMKDIGDAVGASRALVYAYFPDQFQLLDAILERHVATLSESGIVAIVGDGTLIERATGAASFYLRHIVENGATLEIVLREAPIARQLNGEATRFRGRIYRRLANIIRIEMKMGAHEALALVQLLAVIPEEAGRMVVSGVLTIEEALELSNRLIGSSNDALRPNTGRS
jgi:AcrR family transcriptional regulator